MSLERLGHWHMAVCMSQLNGSPTHSQSPSAAIRDNCAYVNMAVYFDPSLSLLGTKSAVAMVVMFTLRRPAGWRHDALRVDLVNRLQFLNGTWSATQPSALTPMTHVAQLSPTGR